MKKWWIIGIIIVVLVIILGIYFYPKSPQEKCSSLCIKAKTNLVNEIDPKTGARTKAPVEDWALNVVGGACITYDNAVTYFNVSKSYLTGTHVTPCDENTICVCVLDDGSFRGIG